MANLEEIHLLMQTNPNDVELMQQAALIQIQSGNYLDALANLSNIPGPSTKARKVINLLELLLQLQNRLLYEQKEYESPNNQWYKDRMQKLVEQAQGQKELQDSNAVYILTSNDTSQQYNGYEKYYYYSQKQVFDYHMVQSIDSVIYNPRQSFRFTSNLNQSDSLSEEEFQQIPFPITEFPLANIRIKKQAIKFSDYCDVLLIENALDESLHKLLKWDMDRLASQNQDFFVPNYQNIIDPNLSIYKDQDNLMWKATDFKIEVEPTPDIDTVVSLQFSFKRHSGKQFSPNLIKHIFSFTDIQNTSKVRLQTPVANLSLQDNLLTHAIIQEVMNTAIPYLATLKRPALLLPGNLQAVVKAQRIYLGPQDEEYTGVWHQDGKNENIVAAVLYYYRYDNLEGGEIEFIDKLPIKEDFWIHGDCDPDVFSKEDIRSYIDQVPRCKVPIKEGNMVIFSNYQMVHRILRMQKINKSEYGYRDFLAFFIVDQRSPLENTLYPQTLDDIDELRKDYFLKQLRPSGTFGIDQNLVYSTGNGSAGLLGWLYGEDNNINEMVYDYTSEDRTGMRYLELFDQVPPLGRGLSWTVQLEDIFS